MSLLSRRSRSDGAVVWSVAPWRCRVWAVPSKRWISRPSSAVSREASSAVTRSISFSLQSLLVTVRL